MIRTAHAPSSRPAVLRFLRRRPRVPDDGGHEALVRALCHDMRGPLASIAGALGHLGDDGPARAEMLELAQASTAQLASLLRTAEASDEEPAHRPTARRLGDVVAAAVAASGLPREQLSVRLDPDVTDVTVGDARLQRILWNLLENAHRHGDGAPVVVGAEGVPGWVQVSVAQAGLAPQRVLDHLAARRPPAGVTGLGLWSVQRQTRELGGYVLWDDDGAALTIRLVLPDR